MNYQVPAGCRSSKDCQTGTICVDKMCTAAGLLDEKNERIYRSQTTPKIVKKTKSPSKVANKKKSRKVSRKGKTGKRSKKSSRKKNKKNNKKKNKKSNKKL